LVATWFDSLHINQVGQSETMFSRGASTRQGLMVMEWVPRFKDDCDTRSLLQGFEVTWMLEETSETQDRLLRNGGVATCTTCKGSRRVDVSVPSERNTSLVQTRGASIDQRTCRAILCLMSGAQCMLWKQAVWTYRRRAC
jgi:hypothetical protein